MVKPTLKTEATFDFKFTGSPQSIWLSKGFYRFECWGASGFLFQKSTIPVAENGCLTSKGRGGYVSGFIQLNKSTEFFVYVGESPNQGEYKPIFNNNNISSHINGAGSTDIRYVGGDWYLFSSLKSRIIVAGAGGSGERYCGGDAGGLSGFANEYNFSYSSRTTPGNQTHGGSYGTSHVGHGSNGRFGFGGDGNCHDFSGDCDHGPGGGSGYYGGGGVSYAGFGSGGSSFISGHPGCDAIEQDSTEDNIKHSGQPDHFKGYVFFNTIMKSGNERMLSPDNQVVVGHEGHGFARITRYIKYYCHNHSINKFDLISFTLIFFLFSK